VAVVYSALVIGLTERRDLLAGGLELLEAGGRGGDAGGLEEVLVVDEDPGVGVERQAVVAAVVEVGGQGAFVDLRR
jgi:hypothetical protein